MVETITPVVHGGRGRWAVALTLHVLGATLTAAAFGLALGLVGSILDAPWLRAGAVLVAVMALVYAANELPGVSMPVPQMRRQVPDWWRTYFAWPTTSFLYGAGLGIGFLTFLAHGTLVVVALAAAASGRPLIGALIVAPFGLARGLSAATSIRVDSTEDGTRLVDRLASRPETARAIANGAALLAVALLAARGASQVSGGWLSLGVAALAAVFAWAATSKLVAGRRWRRALSVYGLPAGVERAAAHGVPVVELLVPTLIVLGASRAAGVAALVMLVAFSIAATRVAIRHHGLVACGCFGGRTEITLRRLLARNAALAALAVAVAVGARGGGVSFPGIPTSSEALPMLLAVAGLVVAMLTLWRSLSWLGRGRAA
jgi:hypothetical protein